jgi:hypothetical protein
MISIYELVNALSKEEKKEEEDPALKSSKDKEP